MRETAYISSSFDNCVVVAVLGGEGRSLLSFPVSIITLGGFFHTTKILILVYFSNSSTYHSLLHIIYKQLKPKSIG